MPIKLPVLDYREYQKPLVRYMREGRKNKTIRKAVYVAHRRCLAGETRVTMSDGSWKYIMDLKQGDSILSYANGKITNDIVSGVWSSGIKESMKVLIRGTSEIFCSSDHRFGKMRNNLLKWEEAKDLKQISSSAFIRHGDTGHKSETTIGEEESYFIGLMCSDGCFVDKQTPKFTNNNKDLIEWIYSFCKRKFGYTASIKEKGNGYDIFLTGSFKERISYHHNTITLFLSNIFKTRGKKKNRRIPSTIWSMTLQEKMAFLSGVIDGDGSVSATNKYSSSNIVVSCGLSKEYAIDLWHLLSSCGIRVGDIRLDKSQYIIRITIDKFLQDNLSLMHQGKKQKLLSTIRKGKNGKQIFKCGYYPEISKYKPIELFDIETAQHHCFFANGILVHNSGKDVTCWQLMIEEAIQDVGTYFYCLPEFNHARRVIFDGMLNDGIRFLDLIPSPLVKSTNQSQMKIELVNGSIIQLVGSDQYDRLVGTNPKGIVFSEYSITHPMAWQILRPILAANGGWAIFNGTPRGKNHFYDILQQAKADPGWFWAIDTVKNTGILSEETLEKEKSEMDIDTFNQEYYASFDAAIRGAYYSEQVMSLREQNRLCKVPYDPKLMVYTAFDPGDSVTAIVFFQMYGKEIRIIDAQEFYNPSVESIFTFITEKPYKYGKHYLPFDATVSQMATGMSIMSQLRKLGLQNIQDLPQQKSKMDGIMLVKSAFSSFWIDEKLERTLLESLSAYAPKFSEQRNTYSSEPNHDWSSHFSDSVRYMVIASLLINPIIQTRSVKPRISIIRRSGVRN